MEPEQNNPSENPNEQIDQKELTRQKNIEYAKNYYQKNKEKMLEYQKQKKYCDVCQKMISRSGFSNHTKRIAHLQKEGKQNFDVLSEAVKVNREKVLLCRELCSKLAEKYSPENEELFLKLLTEQCQK